MLHRIALIIIATALSTNLAQAQQQIVLRSLVTVESPKFEFDEFHIVSADGQRFTWDQILTGTVAENAQTDFDDLLKQIGTPLFRIRHRLLVGDFESLRPVRQSLQSRFDDGPTTSKNCRTRFLLNLASFCDLLAAAEFEYATTDLLAVSTMLAEFPDELQSERMPQGLTIGEVEQCFSSSLIPVWFDPVSAQSALQQIQSMPNHDWAKLPDGGLVYASSLAIAAKHPVANDVLGELGSRSSTIKDAWLPLLLAYQEVTNEQPGRSIAALQKEVKKLNGAPRAVAQFLLGVAAGSLNKRFDDGMLYLLYVPAVFGDRLPHLSAAALLEASKLARESGNRVESKALEDELTGRYPNSQHAKQLNLK